jgi:hypothetical protein
MGRAQTDSEEAHHIVAQRAKGGERARKILEKFGINIHDAAANGVALSKDRHKGLHTKAYYQAVTERLMEARSKEDALRILGEIADDLQCGRPISGAGS